jgi:hypothetical protein
LSKTFIKPFVKLSSFAVVAAAFVLLWRECHSLAENPGMYWHEQEGSEAAGIKAVFPGGVPLPNIEIRCTSCNAINRIRRYGIAVCTENPIRVDEVMESPKLAE